MCVAAAAAAAATAQLRPAVSHSVPALLPRTGVSNDHQPIRTVVSPRDTGQQYSCGTSRCFHHTGFSSGRPIMTMNVVASLCTDLLLRLRHHQPALACPLGAWCRRLPCGPGALSLAFWGQPALRLAFKCLIVSLAGCDPCWLVCPRGRRAFQVGVTDRHHRPACANRDRRHGMTGSGCIAAVALRSCSCARPKKRRTGSANNRKSE